MSTTKKRKKRSSIDVIDEERAVLMRRALEVARQLQAKMSEIQQSLELKLLPSFAILDVTLLADRLWDLNLTLVTLAEVKTKLLKKGVK